MHIAATKKHVTAGHIEGRKAGYRGHAIKGIGQHLVTLRAHRWQWVVTVERRDGDALRPDQCCGLVRFHLRHQGARVAWSEGMRRVASMSATYKALGASGSFPLTYQFTSPWPKADKEVPYHVERRVLDASKLPYRPNHLTL